MTLGELVLLDDRLSLDDVVSIVDWGYQVVEKYTVEELLLDSRLVCSFGQRDGVGHYVVL